MPGALGAFLDLARRLAGGAVLPPEDPTGGGDDEADPTWDGGWWRGARRRPAHNGRVGGVIRPWLVVVHTTDVHPSDRTWDGMMDRVAGQAGEGNGAHFWIGRNAGQGTTQSVPVDRNANHAGGPGGRHGWLEVGGQRLHPNRVAIGIEVSSAGLVVQRGGKWYARAADADGITGTPLPDVDVTPDARRPGFGWHKPTDYQLGELAAILGAFGNCPLRVAAPSGWSIAAHTGDDRQGPTYGAPPADAPRVLIGGVPVVGHVTLDPRRKGDPWVPLGHWLQGRSQHQ